MRMKAAEISYFDSHLLEGAVNLYNKPRKDPNDTRMEDEKSTTEIWLDQIRRNIIVMRRDYMS